MEFTTYTIESNPDKNVKVVTIAALIGVAAIVLVIALGFYNVATWLFPILVVIVIALAIVKKGNIQPTVLSKNKLIVTTEEISIVGKSYPMRTIKELKFNVHSFSGMTLGTEGRHHKSDGTENYVSFHTDSEKVNCRFFLNSRKHALILCQVFEEFYKKKIPFIETDMNAAQTYLFKQLKGEELQAFKKKYGYL